MAEPRKLRIVQDVEDAFADLPEPQDETERKRRDGEKLICNRYYPSLVKRAKAEERAAVLAQVGAKTLEEISTVPAIKAEMQSQHAAQIRLALRHGRWFGGAIGMAVGAALACASILAMQSVIWDTAAQNFREQAMTGALLRSGDQ